MLQNLIRLKSNGSFIAVLNEKVQGLIHYQDFTPFSLEFHRVFFLIQSVFDSILEITLFMGNGAVYEEKINGVCAERK